MKHRFSFPFSMRGVSLVELMVSITIGLVILGAVSTMFVSSKANYTTQESMARLQDSARIAMHFISRDLRMAGYYGCMDDTASINNGLKNSGGVAFQFTNGVEGVEDSSKLYPSNVDTTFFPSSGTAVTSKKAGCPAYIGGKCTGTDAIAMRMIEPAIKLNLTATMPNTSAALYVSAADSTKILDGDVLLVSDCGGGDIFQITDLNTTTGAIQHAGGTTDVPGNATAGTLSRMYGPPGASIGRFVQRIYYVGTGTSGQPALYRQNIDGTSREELVEGIEDLEVTFGMETDTVGDRTPRRYLSADSSDLGASTGNWANVVSVRLAFTSRPVGNVEAGPNNKLDVSPKQFTSVVLLRNLL